MTELKIIDSHCHIEQEEFDDDREEVIFKARENGINIISSAITKDTWKKLLAISRRYDSVYASIGLDPVLTEFAQECIDMIHNASAEIVSIGEVGLDYYRERDHSQREKQEKIFRQFISISKELEIPIQVHSRSAGRAALDVLKSSDAEAVHMHAFDGKASLARTASRDLGYYFSIPTSVVRSTQKQKLVKAIEIERLMLETDSPVLGPMRNERNEPGNVVVSLEETARILRRDREELREIILENTLRLYGKIR